MIYLVCFALSVLLAFFANRADKRWKFLALSALSILVTVTLAGLRDYSVGIDVINYINYDEYWVSAVGADSLWEYMGHYFSLGQREPLFALFMGVIAQLTGNFRVFLFLAQLVIVAGVYVGAFRMKHRVRPELVLLLFYLLYYNASLNIIRQYMAMAVVFAFFADLERRRFLRCLVAVVAASLIHTSALLTLIVLVIYVLLYPKKEIGRVSGRRLLIICAAILVGTVCFIPAIKLLMHIGILSTKYAFYLNGEYTRMAYTRMAVLALEVVGVALCYKKLKDTPHFDFYLAHTLVFMCMQGLSTFIQYGRRITSYFALVNVITLLMLPRTRMGKKTRLLWYGVIIAVVLYFWYYTYVNALSGQTYPYKLGI